MITNAFTVMLNNMYQPCYPFKMLVSHIIMTCRMNLLSHSLLTSLTPGAR